MLLNRAPNPKLFFRTAVFTRFSTTGPSFSGGDGGHSGIVVIVIGVSSVRAGEVVGFSEDPLVAGVVGLKLFTEDCA